MALIIGATSGFIPSERNSFDVKNKKRSTESCKDHKTFGGRHSSVVSSVALGVNPKYTNHAFFNLCY